jgi:hypothetical protein
MSSQRGSTGQPRLAAALAAALLVTLPTAPAFAYTIEFCHDYADRAVQESTSADLSYAMRGTASDSGLAGLAGSGSSGGGDSLSSILRDLSAPQDQQTLWQRTFNRCMGITH